VKTTKEILTEARELIAKGWTQGNAARRADGKDALLSDPDATCFCSFGAVVLASRGCETSGEALTALRRSISGNNGRSIVDWNDDPSRTQAEVLAAFDKAIAEVSP
jgi:hypothetical protein